jgi:nitrogen regulatory protein P-II 1
MKEIKAYIRIMLIDRVIRALEDAGVTNITVIDVRALWHGLRREDLRYSVELAERYMNVAKLETLVPDQDAERVIELIRATARTGRPGDGIVYAVPVDDAVHIRTGRRGDAAASTPE